VPRRGNIAKREVLPDPLYNSKLVTRLINNVMYDGKKGVAQKIVYDAFDIIKEKTGKEPLEVFEAAMENVMPVLRLRLAVSAVLPIRYLWRFVPREDRLSVFVGSHFTAVSVQKEQ